MTRNKLTDIVDKNLTTVSSVQEKQGSSDPFSQGFDAYTDDESADNNPYAEGTLENEKWSDGYAEAKSIMGTDDEDEEETDEDGEEELG